MIPYYYQIFSQHLHFPHYLIYFQLFICIGIQVRSIHCHWLSCLSSLFKSFAYFFFLVIYCHGTLVICPVEFN